MTTTEDVTVSTPTTGAHRTNRWAWAAFAFAIAAFVFAPCGIAALIMTHWAAKGSARTAALWISWAQVTFCIAALAIIGASTHATTATATGTETSTFSDRPIVIAFVLVGLAVLAALAWAWKASPPVRNHQ